MISDLTKLILLQSMFILREFLNPETVRLCINCYEDMVANLLETTEDSMIYSEPTTAANSKMFKNLGFAFKNRCSYSGRKFYEMSFDDITDEGFDSAYRIIENFKRRNSVCNN